jgi:hypothetical protein
MHSQLPLVLSGSWLHSAGWAMMTGTSVFYSARRANRYPEFMPRRTSLDAIRAELAWINEKRQILTNAAVVMCGVAKRMAISPADVYASLRRGSGHFAGSTVANSAANTNRADLKPANT